MKPLVTAIMPAYNAEAFIAESLESLLAQDYRPFEVVVVDDGSQDRTAEISESYDVMTIRAPHGGRAVACNVALAAARGELVTAFDADDLWPPNRLSLQVEFLQQHPEVGCVLGRQEWMNPPPWLRPDPVYGDLDGVPIGSAMFRREALEQLGGYDASFAHSEDMDLLVRTRAAGIEIAVLPEIIWYRRYHDGQMTANAPAVPPLLRSLREKLNRERAAAASRLTSEAGA